MKTLVAYYSRTGNTKKVGKAIAKNLNADVDEIIDKKNRKGIIGYVIAGMDALFKIPTKIENKKDPSKYDLVVIGTPIWSWTVIPPIRAYLSANKFRKAAFFCTCGGNKGNAFSEMEKLSKKPIATLVITEKELDDSKEKIRKFCESLKK